MSCISSNFSSFFLDSLNDPSEFAKYLNNGENKFSPFEEFQVFQGGPNNSYNNAQYSAQQQQQHQQQHFNGINAAAYYNNNSSSSSSNSNHNNNNNNNLHVNSGASNAACGQQQQHNNSDNSIETHAFNQQHTHPPTQQHQQQQQQYVAHAQQQAASANSFHAHNNQQQQQPPPPPQQQHRWHNAASAAGALNSGASNVTAAGATGGGAQHFDGSFEFLKYLRHSNDFTGSNNSSGGANANSDSNDAAASATNSTAAATNNTASLIDLDTSTSMKPRSARKAAALLSSASRVVAAAMDNTLLDVFDHDAKHTIFDLQQQQSHHQHHQLHLSAHSSSSLDAEPMDVSNLAFPNSHLNASNSNTSSEGAAAGSAEFGSASGAPKPLATFTIKENFEVHPAHKVEEGIFQHMNKLPSKKKDNLKQLGVRFTGQMTLADKSIVVENFIKFCQEYELTDHRPFLSLNQSGLNKPEQIKLARYLGQGLPSFTLFCIYSNFKNLFCTKRTEIYTKEGYNLPYILDKTKRFLSNTTAGGITTTTTTPIKQQQLPPQQTHCAIPTPQPTPPPQPQLLLQNHHHIINPAMNMGPTI